MYSFVNDLLEDDLQGLELEDEHYKITNIYGYMCR